MVLERVSVCVDEVKRSKMNGYRESEEVVWGISSDNS